MLLKQKVDKVGQTDKIDAEIVEDIEDAPEKNISFLMNNILLKVQQYLDNVSKNPLS